MSYVSVTATNYDSQTLHGAFTFPHETAIFRSAGTLRGILSNGFTTVRDTGGATIAHAKATEEFLIPGPRVFQGGRMLSQTGGHGDDTEVWSDSHCCNSNGIASSALGRLCDGVPECLKAARDNIRKGANHIKVCTSGGIASETDKLESLQFTTEELKAITTVTVSRPCETSQPCSSLTGLARKIWEVPWSQHTVIRPKAFATPSRAVLGVLSMEIWSILIRRG